MRGLAIAFVTLVVPVEAFADDRNRQRLSLLTVLESVRDTHPALSNARARVEDARGQRLARSGAFEPRLTGSAGYVPVGYYEYWQMAAALEQTLPVAGIEVEGGYRMGLGDIPPYYGERATRDGGELFARVKVPLLADRSIDKDRAAIRKAEFEISVRDREMEKTWLAVTRDATVAYWKWVAAGQKLRVAVELLRIAEERSLLIDRQAEQGALPRITKVDNERIVIARRSRILRAKAAFAAAQAELSLYYRDPQSLSPVRATVTQVPRALEIIPDPIEARVELWLSEALSSRPELKILETKRKQAEVDLRLAKNQLLPKIDLGAFVARDLGNGADSLGGTEVGVGVEFSIPLLRREARGNGRSAQAKLSGIAAQRRGVIDRIGAEIRKTAEVATLSRQRVEQSQARLKATRRLAEAENRRLEQGTSTVLIVNLRELDVAAAARDAIDATLELNTAIAELLFARGNLGPAI